MTISTLIWITLLFYVLAMLVRKTCEVVYFSGEIQFLNVVWTLYVSIRNKGQPDMVIEPLSNIFNHGADVCFGSKNMSSHASSAINEESNVNVIVGARHVSLPVVIT